MGTVTSISATKSDPVRALTNRIVQRTWDRVRHLRVERKADRIMVHGLAPSYYVKQLVLEAIRETRDGMPAETVSMNITVGEASRAAG
jgi:hypothetical protein